MRNIDRDAVLESNGIAAITYDSKSGRVREVFENAPHYLKERQVDIRIRTDTVRRFAARGAWQRLLDIGCGDGTISLHLLRPGVHLTLLDLSANMTASVRTNIPTTFTDNVSIRNENFLSASFENESFDLIISIGIMAHVDSPDELLRKIRSLLRPGGTLILEFTDCRHFMGRIERFTSNLKEFIRPGRFRTNRLSINTVVQLLEHNNLTLISSFRYAMVPIPGIQRLLDPSKLYKFIGTVFGNCDINRNAWLGNQYICLVIAK